VIKDWEMIFFAIFIALIFGILGGIIWLAFVLDWLRFVKVMAVFGFYLIANWYILKGM